MAGIFDSIGTLFKPVLDFANAHPVATSILVGAVASAFSPDEMDILREGEKLRNDRDDSERRRREGNLNVGDINLGALSSAPSKFLESQGTAISPMGIINAARRG